MQKNVFLTDEERKIIKFIADYQERFLVSPELNEIMDKLGFKRYSKIYERVDGLIARGLLSKEPGRRRGLKITDQNFIGRLQTFELPILGFISAGQPIEPLVDKIYLAVTATMIKDAKNAYVLQVRGDSMVGDGILDGDYVIVEHREDAQNGDIVVALLKSGLATLKKIFFEDKRIKLMPANKKLAPIYVNEVKIQGRVIGVIRQY